MLNTKLAELLGLKYPIIQGAMANISNGFMAGSVSNAGALGIIATASRDAAFLREEIASARKVTNKAFGVNVMLANPHAPELIDVIVKEKVAVVTTGAGTPAPYMEKLLSAGCKVIPVIPHVRAAQKMEQTGAFAVIAEGRESGGHIGQISTMCLVPQVVDAVKIPVIAAGGIADGRGYLAATALGASGVQMGTLFLASEECPVHDNYKQLVLKADDRSTVVTGLGTKEEVRCLQNSLTERYIALSKEPNSHEALEKLTVGSLRRGVEGDLENGTFMAGQISGMVNNIRPVKQIIEEFMADTERRYQAFCGK